MLGRFLCFAAGIAVFSVGVAGIAGRADDSQRTAADAKDDGGWSQRGGGGWSSASTAKSARSGQVQLIRSTDSHFYADVDVDGTTVRMMVDSGASMIALTRRDAEAMGINVDDLAIGGTASTAGGDVPVRPVMLDSVEVDGIEVRGVEAAVIDADIGFSLLGQSYLSKLGAVNVEGDTMTLR